MHVLPKNQQVKRKADRVMTTVCFFKKGLRCEPGKTKQRESENVNWKVRARFHVKKSKTQASSCDMYYRVLHFKYGQLGADAQDTLVICGWLVYLWRGQVPQGRSKGSSLANPACNKQYNSTLLQTPLHTHF